MAYVVPNSEAQFFISTGLSPSHENTLYFSSLTEKDNYFSGIGKHSVSSVTYQRENRGYIRVELPVSYLISCDYMRFRNNSFENKWFYAFITEVNYINNVTTEVRYELDPLMTWMGAFDLKECYVERQHTHNDGIGNNICDEGLPTGEYIYENVHKTIDSSDLKIAVVSASSEVGGELVNNIYSGCSTTFWSLSDISLLNQTLQDLLDSNQVENITAIYMCPSDYATTSTIARENYSYEKPYTDIDGYVPKNNKLFCYPYKYCVVDNMEGNEQTYMYEYFGTSPSTTSTGNYTFQVSGANNGNLQLLLRPYAYKGTASLYTDPTTTTDTTLTHNLVQMNHFPMCSFNYDTYKAWLAQKNAYFDLETSEDIATSGMNAINSTVSGLAKSGLAGAALGAIGGVMNVATTAGSDAIVNSLRNSITPTTSNKNVGMNNSDTLTSLGLKTFQIKEMCITKNYAQMIDDYFTMYGYAVKQVLTPDMNARPHWTYVKTIGCNVGGAFPASDARIIENIFDNGVRFWHNLNEMGDYSLDNSPS